VHTHTLALYYKSISIFSPRNQEHKVSFFLLVIIVERLVILDQIVIC
jgi:hypothetical protein